MTNNVEGSELNSKSRRRGLGFSLGLVVLLLIVIAAAGVSAPSLLAFLANGSEIDSPLTAGAAHELFVEYRSSSLDKLNRYGWVDQEAGIARVPIDRAITLLTTSEMLAVGDTGTDMNISESVSASDLSNINYNDDILPIFQQHCSKCHSEDNPEEELVLTTYEGVMAGSIYGSVVKPNDVAGSYLVELVESGQMPQRGDDLTPQEIATIIAWIEAGLPEAGNPGNNTNENVAVTPETVSFQEHVLPIFFEHCSKCHGDDNPEQGLVLLSYADVMAGSDYGSVVKPNDVAGSYLVELVESGQMPQRGDDLTPAQIATIIAWIEAGAPDN